MNSVVQVLFTLKDFQEKYFKNYDFYSDNAAKNVRENPAEDFNAQTAKLAYGLLSGRYSSETSANGDDTVQAPSGIRPQMFRSLIGRNHPDFGTKQQQDAADFFQYFLEQVHNHCRTDPKPDAPFDPSTCFQFQLEERLYFPEANQVRYLNREDCMFRLNIPVEAAKNLDEVSQYQQKKAELEKQGKPVHDLPVVRPIISLSQSISLWAEPEVINDYKLQRNGPTTIIHKAQRFINFPDYLVVQLKKYKFNEDWTPKKLDVSMEIPDELDLEFLRAKGIQPGETVMPDSKILSFSFHPHQ